MRNKYNIENVIAERFVKFMLELRDWSINHDCEIEIKTYKGSVVITFIKNDKRISRTFQRTLLSTCDEMLVWLDLENAYKELNQIEEEGMDDDH